VSRLESNLITAAGASAIANAIAANGDTGLAHLYGVDLSEYLDVLLVPIELRGASNDMILSQIRTRRTMKSARGGARY
jgi:hypothetical protein